MLPPDACYNLIPKRGSKGIEKGITPMRILGYPLGWIMWLLYQVVRNYGVALVLFTILTRAAVFPLSIKQQKSSAKMQVFQPKIQEIQKKYANNKEKQQEELMKLYEQHGYNPMGGCLPSLIQMILLFGIIYVVYEPLTHILHLDSATITALTDIVTANAELLGKTGGMYAQLGVISAIQNPETIGLFSSIDQAVVAEIQNFKYSLFGLYLGTVPTWNSILVLVPILSGVTALATSIVSMKLTPGADQQNGMMKGMMYFMPIMSVWIAFSVPCGIGIYWIISNLLAIVQTVVLNKFYSPAKYKAEYEEQVRKVEEQKKREREERKKRNGGKKLPEEIEEEKEAAAEAKRKQPATPDAEKAAEAYMTSKELNRKRLAEARKRDAEKYGEEYIEVTDQDLM